MNKSKGNISENTSKKENNKTNIWYKEKETEKLVKEEEKEREKQIQKYHVNLPPIDMKKILKKIVIPGIKVGVVGAGNIGKKILKKKKFKLKINSKKEDIKEKNYNNNIILNDNNKNISIKTKKRKKKEKVQMKKKILTRMKNILKKR